MVIVSQGCVNDCLAFVLGRVGGSQCELFREQSCTLGLGSTACWHLCLLVRWSFLAPVSIVRLGMGTDMDRGRGSHPSCTRQPYIVILWNAGPKITKRLIWSPCESPDLHDSQSALKKTSGVLKAPGTKGVLLTRFIWDSTLRLRSLNGGAV